jgi:regulator of replication initiation timing
MKSEIAELKSSLAQCENKWNKIVRNTLRENVDLKNENKQLKERARQLESTINATFSSK